MELINFNLLIFNLKIKKKNHKYITVLITDILN